MIVLLDAGPLGLVTNPRANPESQQCKQWLVDLLAQGVRVLVSEIADYEVGESYCGRDVHEVSCT